MEETVAEDDAEAEDSEEEVRSAGSAVEDGKKVI